MTIDIKVMMEDGRGSMAMLRENKEGSLEEVVLLRLKETIQHAQEWISGKPAGWNIVSVEISKLGEIKFSGTHDAKS